MGRVPAASMLPKLLGITLLIMRVKAKTRKVNKSIFPKLEGLVEIAHSELAHAHLPTKDPLSNPDPSASPIRISTAWRATERGSSLGAISVSSLQGSVICDVQCQAPGREPPTPACVIRKAIRSNHTLLANYCLSQRAHSQN